jgi:hypothetical protein
MLDQFMKFSKPVRITAMQVPSSTALSRSDARDQGLPAINGGVWREPWTEAVQADWLSRFLEIALSKPFVESVAWQGLADHPGHAVPHGGLLRSDLAPKQAYKVLSDTRSNVYAKVRQTG